MVFLACKARWVEGAVGGCWGGAGGALTLHETMLHACMLARRLVQRWRRRRDPPLHWWSLTCLHMVMFAHDNAGLHVIGNMLT